MISTKITEAGRLRVYGFRTAWDTAVFITKLRQNFSTRQHGKMSFGEEGFGFECSAEGRTANALQCLESLFSHIPDLGARTL